MTGTATAPIRLRSIPALATALRQMNKQSLQFVPVPPVPSRNLPPMYQINAETLGSEVEAAQRMVSEIAERLRRLRAAYGEWHDFDAPAYFDLPTAFTADAVRVVERVSTVHVIFFADLLLPSFQQATRFWATEYVPAYVRRTTSPAVYRQFFEGIQPEMVTQWERLVTVSAKIRTALQDDIGFMTTSGAEEERLRWQPLWRDDPVAELEPRLTPSLPTISTLTLALDFPLPAQRQPGRIRRLRRNRDRRRRWQRQTRQAIDQL